MAELQERRSIYYLDGLSAKILRPIIGILLRSGVPFNTFAQVALNLYVDIARRDFGIRGRKTNTSRVAMLTGLTRSKVKEAIDLEENSMQLDNAHELDRVRHASRILLGWHIDKRFCDDQGSPLELDISSESGPSFEQLYEEFSGKVAPSTSMLKELVNVGAIEKLPNGKVIARARQYIPHKTDNAALERVCQSIKDLSETTSHNLYRVGKQESMFERRATNQLIPASKEHLFREFLEREGQQFLEKADNFLATLEKDTDEKQVRIGVGMFQISSQPTNKH